MRKFTLKTELVSVDKSSRTTDKITRSYNKMTRTITQESKVAGSAFSRFSQNIGIRAKQISVSLNNMNASVNRSFRKISSSKLAMGFGIGLLAIIGSVVQANIQLDASIASLQAITGKTGNEFVEFRQEIDKISKAEKLFAGDTAKAFEIVGSAQPILLKSADSLGMVTKAVIKLQKAGLMPIEDSAKAVTGTMNQFDLGADQANRVINVLAAGAKEGSANIRELSESMDRVGAVAKAANLSVEQTGAAVELMSKFNLKGSEAGISLKSTILRLKAASLGFASGQFNLNDALNEYNQQMSLIQDPIKKAAREEAVFGKIHILTGKILTENISELDRLTEAMTGTNEATIQANINNNTFKNRLDEISAAWKNSITATEGQGKQMQFLKNIMEKVADNMDRIVSFAVVLIKLFVGFKAIVLANTIVIGAYNIALGIMGALSGTASIAIGANTLALTAYTIAAKIAAITTKVWVAVQLAINAAMTTNPIGLIIVGIALLIAGIILLIKNWDAVKLAMVGFYDKIKSNPLLTLLFHPIIMIVESIKLLISSFKKIKEAFKVGGIVEGFKAIGKSILDFMLLPLKIFLRAISKIPKVGKIAEKALTALGEDVTVQTSATTKETKAVKTTEKITSALDANTNALNKNTAKPLDGWKGKFTTSILKDANISERSVGLAQKEIATSAIASEQNITNVQKDVITSSAPQSVVTQNSSPARNSKQNNGQITVNVVDKTGGRFGLEVEGTGIEIITTGNG